MGIKEIGTGERITIGRTRDVMTAAQREAERIGGVDGNVYDSEGRPLDITLHEIARLAQQAIDGATIERANEAVIETLVADTAHLLAAVTLNMGTIERQAREIAKLEEQLGGGLQSLATSSEVTCASGGA